MNWLKKLILIKQIEKLLKELLMDESRWTSRKFWLVVGVLAASYVLVWKGPLSVDKWLEWAKWILMTYLVVNGAEKFSPNGK